MLRAGLIGFPSTGKTALFQLLTSAREAPRTGGKQDANVGVSRVPDERLDRLTALFNPKKHVPATVEFADMGGVAGARAGAAALLDVAPFRNADALLHVVRMFRDPAVPHPAGSVDAARDVRTMEDEVILADLGVVERRLERLERDAKKAAGNAELKKEQEILQQCRAALEDGRPLRTLQLGSEDAKRLRGFQFLSAKPLLLVLNLDEADLAAARIAPSSWPGSQDVLTGSGDSRRTDLRQDRARDRAARASRRARVHGGSGAQGVGARSRDPRQLRPARLHLVLHGRRGRVPRLVDSARHAGGTGRRRDPHRHLSAASSAPKWSATSTCWRAARIAACRDHGELRLEGKEYIVLDGDVINFRHAT